MFQMILRMYKGSLSGTFHDRDLSANIHQYTIFISLNQICTLANDKTSLIGKLNFQNNSGSHGSQGFLNEDIYWPNGDWQRS